MPEIGEVIQLLRAVPEQGGVVALAVVLTWRPVLAERLIEAVLFALVFAGVALGRGGKVSEQLVALFRTYMRHQDKAGEEGVAETGDTELL